MKNFKFNGKLYGINIRYYENDKIWKKFYCKNGILIGLYFQYHINSNISHKCYFKNGIEIEYIVYYENGNIKEKNVSPKWYKYMSDILLI
jgi:antitoxin component YwqK of YwqJK toxin-antitoxin module